VKDQQATQANPRHGCVTTIKPNNLFLQGNAILFLIGKVGFVFVLVLYLWISCLCSAFKLVGIEMCSSSLCFPHKGTHNDGGFR
jgi:hypothetical protein